MEKQQLKSAGIACLVICAICSFVAIERYATNASKVRAINQSGMGGLMSGGGELKPGIPTGTTYGLFFAVISGIGGAVLLKKSNSEDSREPDETEENNPRPPNP